MSGDAILITMVAAGSAISLAAYKAVYWQERRRLRLARIKERLVGRVWPPKVPENRTVRR